MRSKQGLLLTVCSFTYKHWFLTTLFCNTLFFPSAPEPPALSCAPILKKGSFQAGPSHSLAEKANPAPALTSSTLTKSMPLRRWIPTNGSFCSMLVINSLAFFSIFNDHLTNFCSHLSFSCTGKAPGAPINAMTGYSDTGNLQTSQHTI